MIISVPDNILFCFRKASLKPNKIFKLSLIENLKVHAYTYLYLRGNSQVGFLR